MLHSRSRKSFRTPASRAAKHPFFGRAGAAVLLLALIGPSSRFALREAHAQDADLAAPKLPATNLDAPMAVEWKFTGTPFPNNAAAPVVSENTAFFASGGIVYAVDLASGAQKWRYPSVGTLARSILYTPAYSDGTLFLSTGDGLTALDAATGKLRYPGFVVPNGATTSPIIIGDGVYFGGGNGRIFGLHAATGDPVSAVYRNGVPLQTDISGNMASQNGLLYVITANQVLHAVDALTGNQRWQQRVEGETRGATPVPAGETLFVAAGSALNAYRSRTGQVRWQQPTPRSISAPPVVDNEGTAYIVTSDRAVYALKSVGNRPQSVWQKVVPQVDTSVVAQPLIANDLVIITTQGGGVWALDRATGAVRWNYLLHPSGTEAIPAPSHTGVDAHPVAVGDALYTLSDDGTLTAFRHDASDQSPPTVTPITPQQGDYVNGQPPFSIKARLSDEGSGLNVDTLSMKVDDNQIPLQKVLGVGVNGFYYENATGQLQYTIYPNTGVGRTTALGDGHHTVTVTVKDWMGNTTIKTWGFTVDDTIVRRTATPGQVGGAGGPKGGRTGGGPGGAGGSGGPTGD